MQSGSPPQPTRIQEFVVPTPISTPLAITVDKEGIVWFTEPNASKIGRFDPTNQSFREYMVPGVGDMWGVSTDRDGYVWFTQYSGRGSTIPGGYFLPGGNGRLVRFDPSSERFMVVDIPTNGSFRCG